MEPHSITNHQQLKAHISALKVQKLAQQESLKTEFTQIRDFLKLDQLVEYTANLTPAKQTSGKIPRAGLNIGAELLIDQVWGRHHSILGFLSAFMARRISAILINNTKTIEHVTSKISGFFR